jgi:ABC-2 type transport system ATP-binding protein
MASRAVRRGARVLGARVSHADPGPLILSVRTDGSAAHVRAVLDEVDPGRSLVRSFGFGRPAWTTCWP